MKTIFLRRDYSEEVLKLKAEYPVSSHIDRTIDHDRQVIAPHGETIALLLRNAIPTDLHRLAFELWKLVNDPIGNRPIAMGTRPLPRSMGLNGCPSARSGVNERVLDISKARQGLLGWDAHGHLTKLTVRHPEMLVGNKPLIKFVDRLYKQHLADFYVQQKLVVDKVPHFRLAGTAFTNIYVAKNFRTAYHPDIGNLPGVMTCLVPLGHFKGGQLVLPRYRLAFALKPGDVLFFNPQELHGNLPFEGERLSAALYCGGWVAKFSRR